MLNLEILQICREQFIYYPAIANTNILSYYIHIFKKLNIKYRLEDFCVKYCLSISFASLPRGDNLTCVFLYFFLLRFTDITKTLLQGTYLAVQACEPEK